MPTKRTIKAEAVSQPEVVVPLTAKAVKATKAVKPAKAVEASAVSAPKAANPKAASPQAASKSTPAKAKAVKAAAKTVVPETVLPAVTPEPVIVTHSVPTETFSLAALSDEISRVAYQLWMDGGRQDGRALDDWSRAEDLVKSRYGL